MRRGWWIILPAVLLAVAACRHGNEDEDLAPAGPVESPVRIEVVNNFALPVEIFAVGSGINIRLGTVHPGMSSHFLIPPGMIGNGSIELLARQSTSSQAGRSGPLLLAPGSIVDFVVAAQLFNSTATIRP